MPSCAFCLCWSSLLRLLQLAGLASAALVSDTVAAEQPGQLPAAPTATAANAHGYDIWVYAAVCWLQHGSQQVTTALAAVPALASMSTLHVSMPIVRYRTWQWVLPLVLVAAAW